MRAAPRKPAPRPISDRQREVILLIAEALRDEQIAARLKISTHTVRTHIAAAMRRLDCTNRLGLVFWAIREELVTMRDYSAALIERRAGA